MANVRLVGGSRDGDLVSTDALVGDTFDVLPRKLLRRKMLKKFMRTRPDRIPVEVYQRTGPHTAQIAVS